MTTLEYATLCVLLEKFAHAGDVRDADYSVYLYGDAAQLGIRQLMKDQPKGQFISFGEASKRFYDMCTTMKLK